MLQLVAVRPRLHLISFGFLAFAALVMLATAPRLNLGAGTVAVPPAEESTVARVTLPSRAVHTPLVTAGAAEVTGDLVGNASPSEVAGVAARNAQFATRGCADASAYVTGDMAGDSSPAAIYAALCGR
jgi:hypothetical protein